MSDALQARYSVGAMIFHWVIAILVIVNWRIAEGAEALEGAAKSAAIAPHKAIGITILVLTLLRLGWRLTHKVPPMSDLIPAWQRIAARTVHTIFYLMLIGLPIGGWLAGSYFEIPIDYFGIFQIPPLPVAPNPDAGIAIIGFHKTGGEILLILVALHVLGALKHTFIDKVNGIGRMLPVGRA